ncbi:MAG: tandem-95 repeat protein [Anaerolineae bacterium]|nr:tandem-95 repeat protein [Anaerolineae bacterium]
MDKKTLFEYNLRQNRPPRILALVLACVLALLFSSAALALTGPTSTPPGGVTVTYSDPTQRQIGIAGGLDVAYSNFDFNQFQTLYWGSAGAGAVGLAFDGAIDAPGETMSFSLTQSSLANGLARWTGSAGITYWTGSAWTSPVLPTRFTIGVTDSSDNPIPMVQASQVGIPGSGAVITVTGNFTANLLFEAYYSGSWQPALSLFNSLHTRPELDGRVLSQFSDAFYYTDVPITGLTATNDSPTQLGSPTTLTATITAGTNTVYSWGFGDSTSGNGAVTTHTYLAIGTYTAVVTASNDAGVVTATTTVVVDESIAGLSAINDSPTQLGSPTTLTATITAGSNVAYTWALGDSTSGYGAVLTHTYPAQGTYLAVVTATNSLSILTATTTISITNDPPIAEDDTASTVEDTPVTIDVLSNDSDPENFPLIVSAVGMPISGTAVISGNTSVVYTPTLDFTGQDVFTYTASDGAWTDSATVTVTVTATNDPPQANDDDGGSTDEDTAFTTINVLANDTDPDIGDVLSVSAVGTMGTLGQVINNGNGTFEYDPHGQFEWLAAGQQATDVFTYTASDGHGGASTAAVTITVTGINDPPTISDVPDQAAKTNISTGPITFTVGDVDTSVGSLTLSAATSDPTIAPLGNITFGGTGVTRTVTITPLLEGTVSITIAVSDGAASDSDPLTLTVTPRYVYLPIVLSGYDTTSSLATRFTRNGGLGMSAASPVDFMDSPSAVYRRNCSYACQPPPNRKREDTQATETN